MTLDLLAAPLAPPDFRLKRLLSSLQAEVPDLRRIGMQTLFLVDQDAESRAALARLLDAEPGEFLAPPGALYVLPRLGTLSPWSSKATDIARVCGFSGVRRLEQVRVYIPEGIVGAMDPSTYRWFHDPMTESVVPNLDQLRHVFDAQPPRPLRRVGLLEGGAPALEEANRDWGLALSPTEVAYLVDHFAASGRNPSDAELMMFAQINSEHCRHKIFNGRFTVDGYAHSSSLFQMIKESHRASPGGVLSAYKDNAAVIEGHVGERMFPDADHRYQMHRERIEILMKVETHNHPTGISPHPGAATGAGGEIRDEAATGRGARPKAGLCGFTVSNLRIPGFEQPWEEDFGRPAHVASALSIMLEGPIGAAAYNNEFGRPNLAGYFRTFESRTGDGRLRGFHKPVMIAGGYGNIRAGHVEKQPVTVGAQLLVLGGPAMLIGLGGGAASSMATGTSSQALDFASVQRANPELERRCQEVIDACWALGDGNPILSIHDVGAGGLSNAFPELVHADDRGARFRLRDIECADPALSPMEIWCNEAQERYVLAVRPESLPLLREISARERCPLAVVGEATAVAQLSVEDGLEPAPVNMPMPVLLGKTPPLERVTSRQASLLPAFDHRNLDPEQAADRVLRLPCVASKSFLITIGDRTVGGLSVRDQMVGPWQVPVADCAVTATGFTATTGEAMAMGERPLLALVDAAASGRMAVGEAITNIAAASISRLGDVRLSANWMAAAGQDDEDARLFDAVRAVGAELCPQLGIAIPVGKDSLSMRSVWDQGGERRVQTSPMTVVISAFAPVVDVRTCVTPEMRPHAGDTRLLLIDLGGRRNRLGGSALAQVHGAVGNAVPDLDDPEALRTAFDQVQKLSRDGRILAYHDRSDGGLFVTLCEMAFAGRCGMDISLDGLGDDPIAALFSEELGMVVQVHATSAQALCTRLAELGLHVADIGVPVRGERVTFGFGGKVLIDSTREDLQQAWSETSHRIALLRDDPGCVREEYESIATKNDHGLSVSLTFGVEAAPVIVGTRPRVAILREQGVNGHIEMAYAFQAAGFESVDVHMSDILEGRVSLGDFRGLAACGGFSYGDVLGAGLGWARSILFNPRAREEFERFLGREDRFALGVCNGCQMFAALQEIVPGATHWPTFRRNRSEQFEARWTMVDIPRSRSLFFQGMAGSRLPVAVAHGEGRAVFGPGQSPDALFSEGQVALRFIDNRGAVATRYPQNPNGSPLGITSVCNADGRVTILMPHPERTVAGFTGSWWPSRYAPMTPWFQLFANARKWVG